MSRLPTAWGVVGAAVQGRSHEALDIPCQDAFETRAGPDGILLLALADGAGSADRADQGAQVAVAEALDALSALLAQEVPASPEEWSEILGEVFAWARLELDLLAAEEGRPLRDYAATLTCVAAAGDWLAAASLGDGVVVAGDGGELATINTLQRGEYANETVFLTQEDALDHVQFCFHPGPVSRLAVMSDGLVRLALRFPSLEPFEPFFQPLFAFLQASLAGGENGRASEQLAEFLSSPRVNERTDDDKSLILALRRPVAEPDGAAPAEGAADAADSGD